MTQFRRYFAVAIARAHDTLPPGLHLRTAGLAGRIIRGRTTPTADVSFHWRAGALHVTDGERWLCIASHRRARRYARFGIAGMMDRLVHRYFPRAELRAMIPDSSIVDVGANVGELSLACLDRGASHVTAVEGDSAAAAALRVNLGEAPEQVEIHEIVAADRAGTATFYLATDDANSSIIEPERYTERRELPARPLDEIVGDHPVDILKVDAEGAEPEVLRGARNLLQRIRLATVRASEERAGQSTYDDCERILSGAGLSCERGPDGKQLIATRSA